MLQLKKVLSSIPQAQLNVECLMNDLDFHSSMTREQFEELAAPYLERMKAPLEKVPASYPARLAPHCCVLMESLARTAALHL